MITGIIIIGCVLVQTLLALISGGKAKNGNRDPRGYALLTFLTGPLGIALTYIICDKD
jgi:hypothetical protein